MFKTASIACVFVTLGAIAFAQAKSQIKVFNQNETINGEQRVCFSVRNQGAAPGNGVWISGGLEQSTGYVELNTTRMVSWRNAPGSVHEQRKLKDGDYELLVGVSNPTKGRSFEVTGYEHDGVKEAREIKCAAEGKK